ncbi:cupredoxin domain-containing protein [Candidatus Woesearchaeota archaeon]|nr:cupredoxin domain-containing protein [Candidatus Woesearchaeota archaeon]
MNLSYLAVLLLLVGCAASETVQHTEAPVRDIHIEAFQFTYDPAEIHLRAGERVRFHLSTRDVGHSMTIESLGLHVAAAPDHPGVQEFTAPQPGTYAWKCKVPCGAGHKNMNGTLVVE